jgi:voltage-gated potassium channel
MSNTSNKPKLSTRLLLQESLTARRAAGIIASVTFLMTVAGGILIRLVDHEEYPTIGRGLWFALQTVTTVGYGDATPAHTSGRIVATGLMLTAIGFLAVITASVTAALVENARRRHGRSTDVQQRLDELNARLDRIEAALRTSERRPG